MGWWMNNGWMDECKSRSEDFYQQYKRLLLIKQLN
jgi:hypothetical protein